jgi:hypothetical protein
MKNYLSTKGGDEFLIAGANVDGGVVMFRRVDGGRELLEIVRNKEMPIEPVSCLFEAFKIGIHNTDFYYTS